MDEYNIDNTKIPLKRKRQIDDIHPLEPPTKRRKTNFSLTQWIQRFHSFLSGGNKTRKTLMEFLFELSKIDDAFDCYETIVTVNNTPISVKDIYRLLPSSFQSKKTDDIHRFWISDNVIEAFSFRAIPDSSGAYCFSTLFANHFSGQQMDKKRIKSFKGNNIFEKTVLMIPRHENANHWNGFFLFRNKIEESVVYYDSYFRDPLGSVRHNTDICQLLSGRMEGFLELLRKDNVDDRSFDGIKGARVLGKECFTNPQENSFDCGVFLCSYICNFPLQYTNGYLVDGNCG